MIRKLSFSSNCLIRVLMASSFSMRFLLLSGCTSPRKKEGKTHWPRFWARSWSSVQRMFSASQSTVWPKGRDCKYLPWTGGEEHSTVPGLLKQMKRMRDSPCLNSQTWNHYGKPLRWWLWWSGSYILLLQCYWSEIRKSPLWLPWNLKWRKWSMLHSSLDPGTPIPQQACNFSSASMFWVNEFLTSS